MSNLKHYGVILYKNGLPTELYLNRLFNAGDYTLDSILGGLKLEVEVGNLDCDAYLPVAYILDDKSYKINAQFGTLIELTKPDKVFINGPKANYVNTANK